MELKLAYGREKIEVKLQPPRDCQLITPRTLPGVADPLAEIRRALAAPIGSRPLAEMLAEKKPRRVVIVVNDVTRPTPYEVMLPPLVEELARAGIKDEQVTLVVATGSHRANTGAENRLSFGEEICRCFPIVSHDCDRDLVSIGRLSDGQELVINRLVAEADFIITTGLITMHYIAGFSGGRKSILPGVAARNLIQYNHSLMTDPRAMSGNWHTNPVHWLMLEAARLAGVDFILNVVTNEKKEIVQAVAGDLEQAWLAGVETCRQMNMVTVPAAADVVLVSAGGHPKDINLYQAQKAMEAAAAATRPGGTIILVARCSEGLGEHTFEQWMLEARQLEDIFRRFEQGFVLGGHKAYAIARVLQEKQVILISDLGKELTESLFMRYADSVPTALKLVEEQYGADYSLLLIPDGSQVQPEVASA